MVTCISSCIDHFLFKVDRPVVQARSHDFCVGGRFEQKVDLFVLFFLSVKGGGCGGMLTRLCFKPLCC